ncbi:hypothetical protein FQN50_000106 [Emmonsiellopsis sp. PD_5]|nr:hypothetical protein FQN50_000106 [Emmonsiellopsis sp. PD_5]
MWNDRFFVTRENKGFINFLHILAIPLRWTSKFSGIQGRIDPIPRITSRNKQTLRQRKLNMTDSTPIEGDILNADTRDTPEAGPPLSPALDVKYEDTPNVDEEGETNMAADTTADMAADIAGPDPIPEPQNQEINTTAEVYEPNFEHDRPASSSSSQRSDGYTGEDDDFFESDGVLGCTGGTTSSRSSISSLPGSVVVYPPGKLNHNGTITPSTFRGHYMNFSDQRDNPVVSSNGSKKNKYSPRLSKVAPGVRDRDSPFRHPSSVRALQMGDESEYDGYGYGFDEEDLTPSRSRRYRGARGHTHCQSVSGMSVNSMMSTPPSAKRNYKSPHAKEAPVQKEYPLVLLHCTLLPPSLGLPPGMGQPSAQILKEVLPEKYWARWKLLEDKTIGSGVLRDRGLLISHPQEMYDVLEERLLESLELVRPRLSHGHFLGREDDESGDHGDGGADNRNDTDSVEDESESETCADCGARVQRYLDDKRKWEIRVYAANGLMRAGAWGAAWRDMEKVDVEVGIFLPVEVKRQLERRIVEDNAIKVEEELRLAEEEKRRREVYGEPLAQTQEAIDGLEEEDVLSYQHEFDRSPPRSPSPFEHHPEPPSSSAPAIPLSSDDEHHVAKEVELQTLLANYLRVLASDRRNVALAFLSILVLYLAVGVARPNAPVYGSTADRHFVPPNVSTPMVMEHHPPPIYSQPPVVSVHQCIQEKPSSIYESIIPTVQAAETYSPPQASSQPGASQPVASQPSASQTNASESSASQPGPILPASSHHAVPSYSPSIKPGSQDQPQSASSDAEVVAEAQPSGPSPSIEAVQPIKAPVDPQPSAPTEIETPAEMPPVPEQKVLVREPARNSEPPPQPQPEQSQLPVQVVEDA